MTEMNITHLYSQVARRMPARQIAGVLGLHHNTVARWNETGRVPPHYAGDFKRMLSIPAEAEDQFFTKKPVARQCYQTFRAVAAELGVDLSRYHFIEPSAGCGWFYQLLPPTRRTGIDLMPLNNNELIRADYLLWRPPDKRQQHIVIGNPPFGLRGHLALQFINHSADFADMVAFILPQLFDSDGKGVPAKRVRADLKLAYSAPLPAASFEKPDGSPVDISTVFQVWSKVRHENVRLAPRKTCATYIKIYSLSNGGTPASTRNKAMIGKCDVYLPSTCFSGMRAYHSFDELPNRRGYGIVVHKAKRAVKNLLLHHDWAETAFPSTNGALNLRGSIIEDVLAAGGYHD